MLSDASQLTRPQPFGMLSGPSDNGMVLGPAEPAGGGHTSWERAPGCLPLGAGQGGILRLAVMSMVMVIDERDPAGFVQLALRRCECFLQCADPVAGRGERAFGLLAGGGGRALGFLVLGQYFGGRGQPGPGVGPLSRLGACQPGQRTARHWRGLADHHTVAPPLCLRHAVRADYLHQGDAARAHFLAMAEAASTTGCLLDLCQPGSGTVSQSLSC
jgi:hypothetical protein